MIIHQCPWKMNYRDAGASITIVYNYARYFSPGERNTRGVFNGVDNRPTTISGRFVEEDNNKKKGEKKKETNKELSRGKESQVRMKEEKRRGKWDESTRARERRWNHRQFHHGTMQPGDQWRNRTAAEVPLALLS